MKKRFSEEQIVRALKRIDSGSTVKEISREIGVNTQTIYSWRKRFGGMEVNEVVAFRNLKLENQRLKKLVADQALDIQMLKEVNSRKW